MFYFKIFIFKFFPINWLTSCSIFICNITSLCHKIWNNSMKNIILKRIIILFITKTSKIISCFRNYIIKKVNYNSLSLILNLYIKKNVGLIDLILMNLILINLIKLAYILLKDLQKFIIFLIFYNLLINNLFFLHFNFFL